MCAVKECESLSRRSEREIATRLKRVADVVVVEFFFFGPVRRRRRQKGKWEEIGISSMEIWRLLIVFVQSARNEWEEWQVGRVGAVEVGVEEVEIFFRLICRVENGSRLWRRRWQRCRCLIIANGWSRRIGRVRFLVVESSDHKEIVVGEIDFFRIESTQVLVL